MNTQGMREKLDNSRVMRGLDRFSLLILALAVLRFSGIVPIDNILARFLVNALIFMLGIAAVLIMTVDIFDFCDAMFGDGDDEDFLSTDEDFADIDKAMVNRSKSSVKTAELLTDIKTA